MTALRRQSTRALVPALILVTSVGLAGCGGASTARTATAAAGAPTTRSTVGSTVAPATHSPAPVDLSGDVPASAAQVPVSLSIPAIGLTTSLITLGRNPDGTAEVPTTTTVAGWYTGGPRPGNPGPAVILGHVDSFKGPGVFFHLSQLKAGDSVVVAGATTSVRFVVQRVEQVSKDAFPTTEVYGPVPDAELRLVTCGGPFDTTVGHYEDNVIVFATRAST